MKIGFGLETITPTLPVFLSGYAKKRVSNAVHDDIFVKVIIVEHHESYFGIVNYDLVAVDELIIEKVKEKFPAINFVFSATHTHSSVAGTVLTNKGILKGSDYVFGKVNFSLVDLIVKKTIDAVNIALFGMKDGIITFNSGHFKIGGNRNDQAFEGYDTLNVWCFKQGDEFKAVVTNYACHPTVLNEDNTLISGDFPGELNTNVLKEGYMFNVYLNGCAGDISTRFTRKESGIKEAKRIGTLLSNEILNLVSASKEIIVDEIRFKNVYFDIQLKEKDTVEVAHKKYEDCKEKLDQAKKQKKDRKKIRLLEAYLEGAKANLLYAKNNLNDELRIVITLYKINSSYFIIIPGELSSELANLIKQDNIYFIGYANGYVGYFANEYAYDHNFYEAMSSPFKKGEGEKLIRFIKEEIDGYSR